ncbi:polymorphic toxin type 47 domain-containing protein [Pseudomonas sp. NPDC087639]|uniref:polymorphic toxin type 47 domain-containing protein n=1 Tax=Pseudomonas sp. NPDC087639 TaxID=3364445 RepID=UPI0037F33BF3
MKNDQKGDRFIFYKLKINLPPFLSHIGYQTPGKRVVGGAVRGHILLESVPVSRARIGDPQ